MLSHLDCFTLLWNKWFVPIQFAYSLWVVLCSHCFIMNWAKAHTLAGLSLCPYITASSVPVALCIVGQLQDNDSNKLSQRLTWCSQEVNRLISIWAVERCEHLFEVISARLFRFASECGCYVTYVQSQPKVKYSLVLEKHLRCDSTLRHNIPFVVWLTSLNVKLNTTRNPGLSLRINQFFPCLML